MRQRLRFQQKLFDKWSIWLTKPIFSTFGHGPLRYGNITSKKIIAKCLLTQIILWSIHSAMKNIIANKRLPAQTGYDIGHLVRQVQFYFKALK